MALEAVALPELTPMLVATRREIDSLVQAGRAEIAKLALELRSLQHEASDLERLVEDPLPAGAPEMTLAAIDTHKRNQRQVFAESIEKVTSEATAIVAAARAEADRLITAASGEGANALRRAFPAGLSPDVRLHGADPAAAVLPPVAPPGFQLQALPAQPQEAAASHAPTAEVAAVTVSRGRKIRSFLYADVIIPIVGALIILVVLLAWVG